jgi:Type I phosphodiesterase / nucleotide pyrophosphatase
MPGVGRKLIWAVVDGLGPALLDRAIEEGRAPTLAALAGTGVRSDRCCSTFPSLTPVCLSALVTGEHPSGSNIPSMAWYHRGEGRLVEYGSSIAATLAEGTKQMVDDVLVNINLLHLSPRATTVFEALEDAGLETAAVNTYIQRGRVRHPIARAAARRLARRVGVVDAVYGPRRYFLGELFWSDETGAPRNFGGGIDRHGAGVGRWLVTRDGFDFLFFYLYETDAAQHRGVNVMEAVARADASLGMLVDAAGGLQAFLDRYAVIVVADHSQSPVRSVAEAADALDGLRLFRSSRRTPPEGCDVALAASNRVAMAYLLPGARLDADALARRLAGLPAADVVLLQSGGWHVARRDGGELRFRRHADGEPDARGNRWLLGGDRGLLDPERYPNALERIAGVLECPTAGDVVVSARAGWEFRDPGGGHHLGGGSHGSLLAEDSLVPLIAAGFESPPFSLDAASITDLAPHARRHFGLAPPAPPADAVLSAR